MTTTVRDLDAPPFRAEGRPYNDPKQPGWVDADGVEWWVCDPYPTWYRWENGTLFHLWSGPTFVQVYNLGGQVSPTDGGDGTPTEGDGNG